MAQDDQATHRALTERRALFAEKVGQQRGRIVNAPGDSILAEFGSVVNAVQAALDIQRSIAEQNVGVPDNRRMEFRIGINLGDVLVDANGIYGDGVNVAARLESLAKPGGICLSKPVHDQVRNRLPLAFEDMGEHRVKNVAEALRVFRVEIHAVTASPAGGAEGALPLPAKPSIAVLPFTNMSGDPEQEYFADGIAEEILTALARCGWLFVIARNSSFTYKGRSVDVRQVGKELGVRYVLEGSVRRGGNRLRFTGQLIDATSGAHIWADRFDGELSDVLDLQDRITASVVAAIEPKLQLAEIERLKHKPLRNLDAYDLLLRAQQLEYEFTEESLVEALACLHKALAIDPTYAPAMALAAYCYAERRFQGWTKEIEKETNEGLGLAKRAQELGKEDPNVLWMCALATWQLGLDTRRAGELAYRSLEINPNSSTALTIAGWIEAYSGNYDKGLELLSHSQRLSPRDPRAWFNAAGLAIANLGKADFEQGAAWAAKALAQNSRYTVAMRLLAANLANLGKIEPASQAVKDFLAIEPHLTVSSLRSRLMFMPPDLWDKLSHGLRLGGLRD